MCDRRWIGLGLGAISVAAVSSTLIAEEKPSKHEKIEPLRTTMHIKNTANYWDLYGNFVPKLCDPVCFNEGLISERYYLTLGASVLTDQVLLRPQFQHTLAASAKVFSTLLRTGCGDRIHQGDEASMYNHAIATRFASTTAKGQSKVENFFPIGGGAPSPDTLAHVTVAHMVDEDMCQRLLLHRDSHFMVLADIATHCGMDDGKVRRFPDLAQIRTENSVCPCAPDSPLCRCRTQLGIGREAVDSTPRAACGGIVGNLQEYAKASARNDECTKRKLLAEKPLLRILVQADAKNADTLTKSMKIQLDHLPECDSENRVFYETHNRSEPVQNDRQIAGWQYFVAAAIISVYGLRATLVEISHEFAAGSYREKPLFTSTASDKMAVTAASPAPDKRFPTPAVAHGTATVTVNRPDDDPVFYLGRGTAVVRENGTQLVQYAGVGLDAAKYAIALVDAPNGQKSLTVRYDGKEVFAVEEVPVPPKQHCVECKE
eukprot:TRINITY_DN2618_c0_g1_i1.p1 TRINITY_DN2618_c0_g1~~TRINITY_DN2618_c0_g1_i1.p1  ORF type:complete len:488 (-),score=93.85 TRINITY_DN2618_c0_g1_i1:122-1585(-)